MLWCACVACLQKTGSLLLKTRRGQARPQVIYKVLYNTSNIFFFSFLLLFHIFLQSLINVDLLVHNRFPSMLLDVYLFLSFMFYFQGFLLYSSICLSGHCFIGLWPWKNQVQNMDLKKAGCKKTRVIVIQKEKRQPGFFSFWITMTLFFCTCFLKPIFWTFF